VQGDGMAVGGLLRLRPVGTAVAADRCRCQEAQAQFKPLFRGRIKFVNVMPIFQLSTPDESSPTAQLVEALPASLAQEANLESWLENSPWAITQEPLLIIGRQASAHAESDLRFPDLLAVDKDGNLVIIELKKGRTPREVVAQLLEYAAWAKELSSEDVVDLAMKYHGFCAAADFQAKFFETFEQDEFPKLNLNLRLFIAAEEIAPSVARSCRFLRTCYGVDVSCIEFRVYRTKTGNILVGSEYIVGKEDPARPASHGGHRWSGELPVKQVVWEAAQAVASKKENFAPKDVAAEVLARFPDFNKSTVGCQIISDCVNHTSRHHYPGGDDRYWWVEKGKYQLYDPDKHGSGPGRDAEQSDAANKKPPGSDS
jgi:hypothetical protein